jgi:hypothetical protein
MHFLHHLLPDAFASSSELNRIRFPGFIKSKRSRLAFDSLSDKPFLNISSPMRHHVITYL